MALEAYTVSYDKANYHAPIQDVYKNRAEEIYQMRASTIESNLIHNVGEYRLGVKFDEFYYREEVDLDTGERFLASEDEEGPVKKIYWNAVAKRKEEGLSTHREEAENYGFETFEYEMLQRPVGTMAIWTSPPGDKDGGYGDYSFTFFAQSYDEDGQRQIKVVPYRNTLSLDEHRAYLAKIDPKAQNFVKDTDFLANPFVFSPNDEVFCIQDLLRLVGEEEMDTSWKDKFLSAASPLIHGYLQLVEDNASDQELKKALWALENYAIAYKQGKVTSLIQAEGSISKQEQSSPQRYLAVDFINVWGSYRPPVVLGSCGFAGELPLQGGSIINNGIYSFNTLMQYHDAQKNESCPEIRCGKKSCVWKANNEQVKKIEQKKLTCCPKCGWKP